MTAAILVFFVGACACSSTTHPEEKAESAPVAPVTAGYEAAIVAHTMKPIFRPKGTAPAVWGPGDRYNFLATGEETNDGFFQFEAVVPPGGGPPPHVHTREDEAFYVVRGQLEIQVGNSTYKAEAGDFVFIPRGTAHCFRNLGPGTAMQLVTVVPAGLERFFREVFPPVTDPNAPPPPPMSDEQAEKLRAAAPKYGLEFAPPPDGARK
jgi:quercetin dioxygenase-like cupin family protein